MFEIKEHEIATSECRKTWKSQRWKEARRKLQRHKKNGTNLEIATSEMQTKCEIGTSENSNNGKSIRRSWGKLDIVTSESGKKWTSLRRNVDIYCKSRRRKLEKRWNRNVGNQTSGEIATSVDISVQMATSERKKIWGIATSESNRNRKSRRRTIERFEIATSESRQMGK